MWIYVYVQKQPIYTTITDWFGEIPCFLSLNMFYCNCLHTLQYAKKNIMNIRE